MSDTETAVPAPAATAGHDAAQCRDLECEACFPEYVPAEGDFVKDGFGNVWKVVSTCTARSGCIELRHTVHGHYASQPRAESGAFRQSWFTKVDGPGA
ncbi:hypothetical protein ACIRPQ_29425 [Streptomyces sp. NPDC101213]|uniref:hypothetical protein n=1 Tax=Streptomyces sp. NPDC101213 TaxID=3366130 RepID=UPI0038217621